MKDANGRLARRCEGVKKRNGEKREKQRWKADDGGTTKNTKVTKNGNGKVEG
ncbi:MAG TPA: hypothetical protein P5137_07145 [Candidatus Brocadiia bacterium]|nr:hypothetical protein [Candidatus Brocadiia bacterium]